MRWSRPYSYVLATSVGLCLVLIGLRTADGEPQPQVSPAQPEARQTFAAMCAGCHGLDGSGTQRAPNIAAGSRVQALSAGEVYRIVYDGVPASGMPSFRSLGEPKIKLLVEYVKQFQGTKAPASLSGDPDRGKQVFFGAGGCSSCHMIRGEGGFTAPDLTGYGSTHAGDEIRSAITTPDTRTATFRQVIAVAKDGKKYRGLIRNEDNFSLQLLSTEGKFYLLSKADLQHIERDTKSTMPSDYGTKLTREQLDDIVKYLTSVSSPSQSVPQDKGPDDE
jgi:cytochrome c oxidase cbb3-type subunit III